MAVTAALCSKSQVWFPAACHKPTKHSHPSRVDIFLTDANARITAADGKSTEVHGKAGEAAWLGPTTHVVENIGDKRVEGILVEPKK